MWIRYLEERWLPLALIAWPHERHADVSCDLQKSRDLDEIHTQPIVSHYSSAFLTAQMRHWCGPATVSSTCLVGGITWPSVSPPIQ